jgi:hypothetical protein
MPKKVAVHWECAARSTPCHIAYTNVRCSLNVAYTQLLRRCTCPWTPLPAFHGRGALRTVLTELVSGWTAEILDATTSIIESLRSEARKNLGLHRRLSLRRRLGLHRRLGLLRRLYTKKRYLSYNNSLAGDLLAYFVRLYFSLFCVCLLRRRRGSKRQQWHRRCARNQYRR